MNCRICYSKDLHQFLDLGFTPPADDFLTLDRLNNPEIYYPLKVLICNNCGLVQLNYTVPPQILYQSNYPYESSTTETGRKHFYGFAEDVVIKYNISSRDLVIDIGSNVGVLLEGFRRKGVKVLGIEPVAKMSLIANENYIETINNFFSLDLAHEIVKGKGKAKVITATNVVAHINDLHSLVKGLDLLLDDRGIFIFEAPYLVHLLKNLEYDTIYHEHLSYLSVRPVKRLFEQYGMELIELEEKKIHGGTLRYHIAKKNVYDVKSNVDKFLELEEKKGIYSIDNLMKFADSVAAHKSELVWMLNSLKREGKNIAGVSAPAKGMTLLNYCNIGIETLDFLTEKSEFKIGRYSPGKHIPILPDSELLNRKPDYALLLAWNFADEIIKNNKEYLNRGGKFIIPIPQPVIVE